MIKETFLQIKQSVTQIQETYPLLKKKPAEFGIILGSGLGDLADEFQIIEQIPFDNIPCLPATTAPSHKGVLNIVQHKQKIVLILQGRLHLYEGFDAKQVVMPVHLLAALGCSKLIISNAAGALNPQFNPGEIMLIEDHINFTGQNPLIKLNDETDKNRFVDMSQAYANELKSSAKQAAKTHELTLHQGVYLGVTGPSLETSAERRFFAKAGADAVGMSTVLEVIAANYQQMQVLGLSAITNMAVGDEHQQVDTIEQVMHYAELAGKSIGKLIVSVLET